MDPAAGKVYYILANTERVTYSDLYGQLRADDRTLGATCIPMWVLSTLAYVNELFYKLTHRVPVNKILVFNFIGLLL